MTAWQLPHPAWQELLATLRREAAPIYLVGGAVRDLLLGHAFAITDVDIVVEGGALQHARRAADLLGWAYYPLDESRDVARLVFTQVPGSPLACDIAGMRGGDIETDLSLRDFTVNALALELRADGTTTLLDTTGGQADLRSRTLRAVSSLSLADDPARLLRAVRLATQFGFTLAPATETQLRRLTHNITTVSPERLRDELWKMLTLPRPHDAVRQLADVGLLAYVLPEVNDLQNVAQTAPHVYDVFNHTLATVEAAAALRAWLHSEATTAPWSFLLPWRHKLRHHLDSTVATGHRRGDWLLWYALLHDIGKPATRSEEVIADDIRAPAARRVRFLRHESVGADMAGARLNALRFSRHEIELAQAVIHGHMRPHHLHASFSDQPINPRATFRFLRDTGGKQHGPAAALDVLLLALCDLIGTYGGPSPDWTHYGAHITQLIDAAFATAAHPPRPLLDGHDLMQRLALPPGPQVGDLLDQLLEAQAAGDITTPNDALIYARDWLSRRGA